jgi:hypothetical protein
MTTIASYPFVRYPVDVRFRQEVVYPVGRMEGENGGVRHGNSVAEGVTSKWASDNLGGVRPQQIASSGGGGDTSGGARAPPNSQPPPFHAAVELREPQVVAEVVAVSPNPQTLNLSNEPPTVNPQPSTLNPKNPKP